MRSPDFYQEQERFSLTSSGLFSWRGAVSYHRQLGLYVHMVVIRVPGVESWQTLH